ncbi:MAG: RDD family protein [Myxococcota bacterium]
MRFRYQLAGPGRRGIAWAVDTAIRVAVVVAFAVVLTLVAQVDLETVEGPGVGLLLVLLFAMEWVYGIVFEIALGGRTPGKMVMSLRVLRVDGSPARVPDIVLRNLLRAVDYLPIWAPLGSTLAVPTFGVALLTMVLDPKLRRIGDLAAGTVVVVDTGQRMRSSLVIEPPVTEEERQELPAAVVLSAEELRILEEFIRRRPRLSAERCEELAELFGPALSERTGVQAPTWERVLVLAYARATGRDR